MLLSKGDLRAILSARERMHRADVEKADRMRAAHGDPEPSVHLDCLGLYGYGDEVKFVPDDEEVQAVNGAEGPARAGRDPGRLARVCLMLTWQTLPWSSMGGRCLGDCRCLRLSFSRES